MPPAVNRPLTHQRLNRLSDVFEVQNRGSLKKWFLASVSLRVHCYMTDAIYVRPTWLCAIYFFFTLFRFIKPDGTLCLVLNITLPGYYAKLIKTFAQYIQQDAMFLYLSIYFCKTFYMFQTIFPSLIRNSKLPGWASSM